MVRKDYDTRRLLADYHYESAMKNRIFAARAKRAGNVELAAECDEIADRRLREMAKREKEDAAAGLEPLPHYDESYKRGMRERVAEEIAREIAEEEKKKKILGE